MAKFKWEGGSWHGTAKSDMVLNTGLSGEVKIKKGEKFKICKGDVITTEENLVKKDPRATVLPDTAPRQGSQYSRKELSDLTVEELRELATEEEIDLTGISLKQDIINHMETELA